MTAPPTIQTNPLDPVFSGVPVVIPQSGTVNPTWNKWFVDLREKVNVINQTLATLSGGSVDPSTGALAISSGGTGATTVSGAQSNLGILANPMTAAGDIIIGGTGGTPTRLAKGTNGYVLTLVSGVPAWAVGGGGGGAFTPAQIFSGATLGCWFEVSDISTLFQDTGKTVPVITAGQSIAVIADKSGLGNDAVQGTSGKQATYQVDANGVGYASFSSGDYYVVGSGPLGANSFTFCATTIITTYGRIFDNRGAGPAGTLPGMVVFPTGDIFLLDDGASHYIAPAVTTHSGELSVTYIWYKSKVSQYAYYSSLSTVSPIYGASTSSSIGTVVTSNQFVIGTAIDHSSQPFAGSFYGLVYSNVACTAVQRDALILYMEALGGY